MTVFINKGEKPLSIRQATTRGLRWYTQQLGAAGARRGDETIFLSTPHDQLPERLKEVLKKLPNAPETFAEYGARWEISNEVSGTNNYFNHLLEAYKSSVIRLSKYSLEEGQTEAFEQVKTGQYDDNGSPIFQTEIIRKNIAPLEREITITVTDETDGTSFSQTVVNPLIVVDENERARAHHIINTSPKEVIDFYLNLIGN